MKQIYFFYNSFLRIVISPTLWLELSALNFYVFEIISSILHFNQTLMNNTINYKLGFGSVDVLPGPVLNVLKSFLVENSPDYTVSEKKLLEETIGVRNIVQETIWSSHHMYNIYRYSQLLCEFTQTQVVYSSHVCCKLHHTNFVQCANNVQNMIWRVAKKKLN